jgi:hypothetical protein
MRKMIADSRITWKRRHVKGHQDIPRDQLDIWRKTNDDCDMDAKPFGQSSDNKNEHQNPYLLRTTHGQYGQKIKSR